MANNNDKNEDKRYAKPGDDKIVSGKGFLISMPSFGKSKKNPAKALIDATSANADVGKGKKQSADKHGDNDKALEVSGGEGMKKSRFGKGRRHENADGAKTSDVKNAENGRYVYV